MEELSDPDPESESESESESDPPKRLSKNPNLEDPVEVLVAILADVETGAFVDALEDPLEDPELSPNILLSHCFIFPLPPESKESKLNLLPDELEPELVPADDVSVDAAALVDTAATVACVASWS